MEQALGVFMVDGEGEGIFMISWNFSLGLGLSFLNSGSHFSNE